MSGLFGFYLNMECDGRFYRAARIARFGKSLPCRARTLSSQRVSPDGLAHGPLAR
jgi:hypothetical protein